MTIDEVKNYLNQVRDIDKLIDLKLKRLAELNAQKTAIGSQDFSRERVKSSPSGDTLSSLIDKIVDFQREINADIDHFVDLKAEIMRNIDLLKDPDDKVFLYAKYFEYKKHSVIAEEMCCSERNAVKIHKRALLRLAEILK